MVAGFSNEIVRRTMIFPELPKSRSCEEFFQSRKKLSAYVGNAREATT